MTQPLRDTSYPRELATARLPSGPRGKASAAIERIFVKQAEQLEIRFSSWEGSRPMPRALDNPAPAIDRSRLGGRARVVPGRAMHGVQVLVGSVGQGVAAHGRELV